MSLPQSLYDTYTAILEEELLPAMGCTEPIAIAYAASILADLLGGEPDRVALSLSGNIIKNVKSVIVPATGGMHGIAAAVAAGTVAACPTQRLALLQSLTEADISKVAACAERLPLTLTEKTGGCAFEIEITGERGTQSATVHLREHHTNVVAATKDGQDLTAYYQGGTDGENTARADRSTLNVEDIVTFAESVELTRLSPILRRQIDMNMAIAEEGLTGKYGAAIGKIILENGGGLLQNTAKAYAAAGSDARMSGCEMPVCILSGSGNQGITASVPVVVYARALSVSEETMLRALIVADLITVHQKTGIGCLSAYCGAISAGCGAATGVAYLCGGRFHEIAHTLVNAVAVLSGTICDGAKPSCAAKIAMAVEAGIMGYHMVRSGSEFYGGDGIVTKGVENTIKNIGRIVRDGMGETDREIIRIMIGDGRP